MRRGFGWLMAAALGVVGCGDSVSGSLDVRSASGDAFSFDPDECVDGRELGYSGVQLVDGDRRFDFAKRNDEPFVFMYSPGETAFELDLSECEVFEGRLKRRSVNGSGKVEGNFVIECSDVQGHSLYGELHFEDCRGPDDD